jgi:hypothetical protein
MSGDQTTVWSALALQSAVQYGVPYCDPNTLQPAIDVIGSLINFAYKPAAGAISGVGVLSIGTFGDLSGTDPLSLGGQGDSYLPVANQQPAVIGGIPGFGVSTSRGTRYVPLIALSGDLIGEHGSYALVTNAAGTNTYLEAARIAHYLSGGHATNPGGSMRFGTKSNGADALVEYLELDSAGNFFPIVTGVGRLGKASKGFGALTLDYTITATNGAVVMNKPSGRVNVAAGATSIVVTNSLVTANSIIQVTPAQADANNPLIRSVVAAGGSFTITVSTAPAANQAYNFLVINTDS